MTSDLGTLALALLVLAASSGCAHRATTVQRTTETIRTDTGRRDVAPTPVVEETTTVIKRSHADEEEDD